VIESSSDKTTAAFNRPDRPAETMKYLRRRRINFESRHKSSCVRIHGAAYFSNLESNVSKDASSAMSSRSLREVVRVDLP
jgi:hypothetical protein